MQAEHPGRLSRAGFLYWVILAIQKPFFGSLFGHAIWAIQNQFLLTTFRPRYLGHPDSIFHHFFDHVILAIQKPVFHMFCVSLKSSSERGEPSIMGWPGPWPWKVDLEGRNGRSPRKVELEGRHPRKVELEGLEPAKCQT